MDIAAVILAAGASRRMGSPKALLEVEGKTLLDRMIGLLRPHCAPVIVVLGHDAARVREGVREAGDVRFVLNPRPEEGQLSSLRRGLLEAPPSSPGVLFTPVDYPAVRPSTIAALTAAFLNRGEALVVVPACGGARGHPVAVDRSLIAEILALEVSAQARDVIHRHRDRTLTVEVADPGILRDADDPEAYRELTGQGPAA